RGLADSTSVNHVTSCLSLHKSTVRWIEQRSNRVPLFLCFPFPVNWWGGGGGNKLQRTAIGISVVRKGSSPHQQRSLDAWRRKGLSCCSSVLLWRC
ncbi:hypothetical protein LINPERHAP1_LOCUS35786, partial [Linum perenne]